MACKDEDVVGFLLTSSLSCGVHPSPEKLQDASSQISDVSTNSAITEDPVELEAAHAHSASAPLSTKEEELVLLKSISPEIDVQQETIEPESPTRGVSPSSQGVLVCSNSMPVKRQYVKHRMAPTGRHKPRLRGTNSAKYPVGAYPARVSTPEELAAIARVYSSTTPDFPRTPPSSPSTPMFYPPTPPSPPPSPLDPAIFMPQQLIMVQDLGRKLVHALSLAQERTQEAIAVRERSELEASELRKSLLELQDKLSKEEQRRQEEEENLRKDLQAREDLLKEQELRAASMQQELQQLKAQLIDQQISHQYHPYPHSQHTPKNSSRSSSLSPLTSGTPSPFTSPILPPTPPPSVCGSPFVCPASAPEVCIRPIQIPSQEFHRSSSSNSLISPISLDSPSSPHTPAYIQRQLVVYFKYVKSYGIRKQISQVEAKPTVVFSYFFWSI